jgi:hypothetical protein
MTWIFIKGLCNEKHEENLKLEDAAFDCYKDEFENALQQIRALHPDIDLSGADSSMRVLLESFCSIWYSIGVILRCQVSTNLFPLWIGVVSHIFLIIFFAELAKIFIRRPYEILLHLRGSAKQNYNQKNTRKQ